MNSATVIYLSPYDILRPRTNQVSDVRFTEGFAQNGCTAHFICPFVERTDNIQRNEIESIYGLSHPVSFHMLNTRFRKDVKGIYALTIIAWKSIFKVRSIVKCADQNTTCILISRSPYLLAPFLILKLTGFLRKLKIVHWAHDVKTSALAKWIYRHCNTIIATNSSILHAISPQLNDDRLRHLITSNPVTEKQAEKRPDKIAARMQLGISTENRPLIVYTGKIGIGYSKELEFILSASTLNPEYQFLLTGGTPQAVEYWKKHCESIGASNVTFTGYIHDYSKIHLYQESADVLISYYTHQGHDVRYNLPNKLCEYMLTDNIVVSPDYPATRDLLHNENCKFVEAENAHALAEGIKWCIQNPAVAKKIAARAGAEARLLTFRSICAKLLKSIA